MTARIPGSGPGRAKRTARDLVPGVERVPGREAVGVPQPLIPALVRVLVLVGSAPLALGTLPTPTLVLS